MSRSDTMGSLISQVCFRNEQSSRMIGPIVQYGITQLDKMRVVDRG
jgi:hypothetical protein